MIPLGTPEGDSLDLNTRLEGTVQRLAMRARLTRFVRVGGYKFDTKHTPCGDVHRDRYRLTTGKYEKEEIDAARRWLRPDMPVLEAGGGIGVLATVVDHEVLDPETPHVVAEADRTLFEVVNRNRDINGCSFQTRNVALGGDGVALAQAAKDLPKPIQVMLDVEGAEFDIIDDEADWIAANVATFIVELHPWATTPEGMGRAVTALTSQGMELAAVDGVVYTFRSPKLLPDR